MDQDVHPEVEDEPYRLVPDGEPLTIEEVAAEDAQPIEGDPLSENFERAKRAAQALGAGPQDARDDSERVTDLLSDLFHLCDLLGLDMDEHVDRAQRHYAAETMGEL